MRFAFIRKLIVGGAMLILVSLIIVMQHKFVTVARTVSKQAASYLYGNGTILTNKSNLPQLPTDTSQTITKVVTAPRITPKHTLKDLNNTALNDGIYDKNLQTSEGHLSAGFIDSDGERLKSLKTELQRIASPDNTVLLVLTDKSVEQMALNFYLTSLKPFNITNYLYLATDPQHCGYLRGQGISCFAIGNETGGKGLIYRSKEFIKRMNLRLETYLSCVEMGFNILASDVDMTYLKNPFPEIKSNDGKSYDLYFLGDTDSIINAGFMLLHATKDVVQRLQTALKTVRARPSVDDQQAINSAFQTRIKRGKIFKLPRSQYFSGDLYWEPGYAREFRDEMKPCDKCIVIHNNWIVSVEAKMYRARESGQWVVDVDKYYSDPDRKYLTYENPVLFAKDKDARVAEWNAIRSALAYAQILNRTLILPKFSCGADRFNGRNRNCSFLHRTKIRTFEEYFPFYREHSFLLHELVPASTKSSVSPVFCVDVSNNYVTPELRSKCKTAQIPVALPDKGATATEVLTHFDKSTEKILRFAYMYGVFSSFGDSAEDKQFEDKVKKSLVTCHYRQY